MSFAICSNTWPSFSPNHIYRGLTDCHTWRTAQATDKGSISLHPCHDHGAQHYPQPYTPALNKNQMSAVFKAYPELIWALFWLGCICHRVLGSYPQEECPDIALNGLISLKGFLKDTQKPRRTTRRVQHGTLRAWLGVVHWAL